MNHPPQPTEPGRRTSVTSTPSLRAVLREDWETHTRSWSKPGLHALTVHRLGVWLRSQPARTRLTMGIVHRILRVLVRNVYGTDIHDSTTIGHRVRIAHHVGVVLGAGAVLGDDIIVRQNVTLCDLVEGSQVNGYPCVGNGVSIGAGAVLAGPITVGAGAVIGPGAVVLADVPAGATVFAPPARVMGPRPTPGP